MKTKDLIVWIIILPVCLLIALLSTFPLHWFLWSTLNKFVDPYPVYIERLLTPLVMGSVFVWSSFLAAPYKKKIVSIVFGVAWSLFFLSVIIIGSYELSVLDIRLNFNNSDIVIPIFGLLGGVIGIYLTNRK